MKVSADQAGAAPKEAERSRSFAAVDALRVVSLALAMSLALVAWEPVAQVPTKPGISASPATSTPAAPTREAVPANQPQPEPVKIAAVAR